MLLFVGNPYVFFWFFTLSGKTVNVFIVMIDGSVWVVSKVLWVMGIPRGGNRGFPWIPIERVLNLIMMFLWGVSTQYLMSVDSFLWVLLLLLVLWMGNLSEAREYLFLIISLLICFAEILIWMADFDGSSLFCLLLRHFSIVKFSCWSYIVFLYSRLWRVILLNFQVASVLVALF